MLWVRVVNHVGVMFLVEFVFFFQARDFDEVKHKMGNFRLVRSLIQYDFMAQSLICF